MEMDKHIASDGWGSNNGMTQGEQRNPLSVLELRKKLGMTQEQLARELGVTVGTVNRWENGRFRPSPLALRGLERLAERAAQIERHDSYTPAAISGVR